MRNFLIRFLLLAGLIFGGIELIVRGLNSNSEPSSTALIDIQSPNHLIPILRQLQRLEQDAPESEHETYVLIGDSLWLGKTMYDHGAADWQQHTLDKQLSALTGNDKVKFVNLGIDGLLPVEILTLSRAVKNLGADGVIADVGLRSVSQDFNAPNTFSRAWLAEFEVSEDGEITWDSSRKGILHKAAHYFNVVLSSHSQSYNALKRKRMQWFNDAPASYTQSLFNKMNSWMAGDIDPPTSTASARSLALMKARARYKSASFDPSQSDQAVAILQLAKMAEPGFSVTLVYAQEDETRFSRVADLEKASIAKQDLANRLKPVLAQTEALKYIDDIDALRPEYFLDLVHVNKEGYGAYASEIAGVLP